MHLFCDFGTRGMPGCFYLFYVKVVIPMARSELVVTLPLVIYVDDNALIGPVEGEVNAEMGQLQEWTAREIFTRPIFKALKDRRAARRQLYIGFWWESLSLTLTLEERKLRDYVAVLLQFARTRVVSLHDLQSLAGKV